MKNNNLEDSFRPIVGIDLGTTNSAAAYIHNKKPKIISLANKEKLMPSVVLIDLDNNIVVGKDALDSLVAMPDRTLAAIKRKMGSDKKLSIASRELFPHEVSALILKEIKKHVDDLLGQGEKEAVITVPAYFTDAQRRATKQAGELAGFVVERIINEPTAAALAYGLDNKKRDGHILVYDLGGGTFDVSIVEMMGGILEVKASSGNNLLGGEDFDWKLVDFLSQRIISDHKLDPRKDIRAKALLKKEAERAKIGLSSKESVDIDIPVVIVKDNEPIGLNITITREEFIGLIEDLLVSTINLIEDVLRDADLSADDIDEVLLVGGSTKIPKVHDLIFNLLGEKIRNEVNPDEVVALGAAVQAGLKSGSLSKSGLIATDVAPFSMGVASLKEWNDFVLRPGGFVAIIPKNTTIPTTRSEVFFTSHDGQTEVDIEIYQGEHEWVENNYRLGNFTLGGLPSNIAGAESIDVKFRYNLNGILEVTARSLSNGKEMAVVVQDALDRNSEEGFNESLDRIESLFNEAEIDNFDFDDEDEYKDIDWDMVLDEAKQLSILDEGDRPWEDLEREGKSQIKKLKILKDSMNKKQQKEADKFIKVLGEAIKLEDGYGMERILDDVIDFIIDLEI